ncbi:MAG: DUF4838 domain-containing protein [Clostridia bacterium]|nr:DUF4838 domain-containing protein [Clostridia bacterium]
MRLNIKMNFNKIIVFLLAVAITLSCLSGAFGAIGVFGAPTYVVNEGQSEYKIVIADTPDSIEKTASYELQRFFEEATGVTLDIVSDKSVVPGGKYLSIGNTALVTKALKSELEGLKSHGYILKTVNQTIYMLGPSVYGSLASVYEFLKQAFDYEYFFTEVYNLKKVKALELKNYDLRANPDIDGMTDPGVGYIQYDLTNKNRFLVAPTSHYFIPANGTTNTHNLWHIMPQSWAGDPKYSNWFSANGQATACFNARGNPTDYQKMITHFSEVAIKGIKESNAEIFTIAQPDNCGFCNCNACSAYNGDNSAIVVKFCNDVAAKVDAWLASSAGKPYARDFKLIFLAYQSIAKAPTTSGIKCADNVGVYLAFDYCRSSYSLNKGQDEIGYDGVNRDIYNTVKAWKNVTDLFVFWLYDVNFDMYFYPYDTTDYKVDFYKLMKEVGTVVVNDLGQHQNKYNNTAWGNVKGYLSTKLRWDVNLNVNDTVRKFFDACYKDAADIMYNVYLEYKAHWAMLRYEGYKGTLKADDEELRGIFGNLRNTAYWGRDLLESWIKQFKQAIAAIEPLKATDPDAYQTTYGMIAAELTSPYAMLIELYRATYSDNEFKTLVAEFKKYCADAQLVCYADGATSTMDTFYETRNI